jgi:hypothetical protein
MNWRHPAFALLLATACGSADHAPLVSLAPPGYEDDLVVIDEAGFVARRSSVPPWKRRRNSPQITRKLNHPQTTAPAGIDGDPEPVPGSPQAGALEHEEFIASQPGTHPDDMNIPLAQPHLQHDSYMRYAATHMEDPFFVPDFPGEDPERPRERPLNGLRAWAWGREIVDAGLTGLLDRPLPYSGRETAPWDLLFELRYIVVIPMRDFLRTSEGPAEASQFLLGALEGLGDDSYGAEFGCSRLNLCETTVDPQHKGALQLLTQMRKEDLARIGRDGLRALESIASRSSAGQNLLKQKMPPPRVAEGYRPVELLLQNGAAGRARVEVYGDGVHGSVLDAVVNDLLRTLGNTPALARLHHNTQIIVAQTGTDLTDQERFYKANEELDDGDVLPGPTDEWPVLHVTGFTAPKTTMLKPIGLASTMPGSRYSIALHEEGLVDFRSWPVPDHVKARMAERDPLPVRWTLHHEIGNVIRLALLEPLDETQADFPLSDPGGDQIYREYVALVGRAWEALKATAPGSHATNAIDWLEAAHSLRKSQNGPLPTFASQLDAGQWFAEVVAVYLAGNTANPGTEWLRVNDPSAFALMEAIFQPAP